MLLISFRATPRQPLHQAAAAYFKAQQWATLTASSCAFTLDRQTVGGRLLLKKQNQQALYRADIQQRWESFANVGIGPKVGGQVKRMSGKVNYLRVDDKRETSALCEMMMNLGTTAEAAKWAGS